MKKILLVEDDPFLIDIYKKKLENSGFEVKVAKQGNKAIKLAIDERPDLIILDIVLPEMDGWEILKKLKSDNKTKNIQVVFLSNLGQKQEVEKGLKLGAIKYLIKAHYTPSDVVKEIKKIV